MLTIGVTGGIGSGKSTVIKILGEFGATLMLAGDIPGRTETIPLAIYFAVEADEMTRAFQWSAIDVGISLVLLFAMYSWTRTQVVARVRVGRG
jgi:molybdate transport system permease protein